MEKQSFGLISASGGKGGREGKAARSGAKSGRSTTTVDKSAQFRLRSATKGERRVSSSALRRDTRPTLDLLQDTDAVAVTHYNEVEGYLVAPDRYLGLVARVEEADERESELASTMTVLLAAARTGVAVPSEMLERVMPHVDVAERWREIAEFAATFPTRITAGEHGEPITRAHLSHVGGPIEEFGSDDDLNLG